MSTVTRHWTNRSFADFVYRISADFALQIELKLEAESISRAEFAKKLGVGRSRVSQLLNDPGNLTLENMVRCASALGMKVTLLAYDDGDPLNQNGPIGAEVFRSAWDRAGRPRDMFAFEGAGHSQSGELVASQEKWFLRPQKRVTPKQTRVTGSVNVSSNTGTTGSTYSTQLGNAYA